MTNRHRTATARIWGALVLCGAIVSNASAQIAVRADYPLSFGSFVAGSGGTVTVDPQGRRSANGGVVLTSSLVGGAARFTVSGEPNQIYSILLPEYAELAPEAGGQSMRLLDFSSQPDPSEFGRLSVAGTQTLNIGATLRVDGNQTPGSYAGAFDVTVEYQ